MNFNNLCDHSVIRIPTGIHRLSSPVVICGNDIRIVGEDGAVLSGTVALSRADFTENEPGVFSAPVPFPADALIVCGRRYTMARYPKKTDASAVFGGYAADCILPEKTSGWENPSGGYIHAMHRHLWGGYSYKIEGKNPDGSLNLSGGWQNNRQMGMHDEYRFAENIREEMTEPGEWYFDEAEMRVYVRPYAEDDLGRTEIAVSRGFFILENCTNVTIENLTFENSVRTFMETKEPLLRSDWTIYRGGAVTIRDSSDCTIDRCTFRNIGSNGVFVDGACENIRLTRSHLTNIGASGVCFVGHPDAVRSPLFEYNETHAFAELDLTPGPKSDNYPKNGLIEDCLIEYVGTTEKQASGIEVSMAYGITIKNCTVCHTSRAGINLSEGTFGGHRIEGCDVFDTVRETGDHGSFNSWGRDRFWHVRDLDDRDAHRYAALDMLAPNVITRSRFRCDRGWDIDLDDGSSNFIITENLCLNGGLKLREGCFRTVRNNITVNNTMHFHVWYPESGDVVENNLVFREYAPYGMPDPLGKSVNFNILHTPGQTVPSPAESLARSSGQDADSVCIDAQFRSPKTSDYTPTCPLIHGFENFPTEFGVRYEPLRQIAGTPVLPKIVQAHTEHTSASVNAHGITAKTIDSDGEMSVYGTAGHQGALVLAVDETSIAWKRGIRPDDVLTEIGTKQIRTADDLAEIGNIADLCITLLRKQKSLFLGV